MVETKDFTFYNANDCDEVVASIKAIVNKQFLVLKPKKGNKKEICPHSYSQ